MDLGFPIAKKKKRENKEKQRKKIYQKWRQLQNFEKIRKKIEKENNEETVCGKVSEGNSERQYLSE